MTWRDEVTDPTPAPPLEGRGAAAPSFEAVLDFFKWEVLSLGNAKKNKFSFCISLVYS